MFQGHANDAGQGCIGGVDETRLCIGGVQKTELESRVRKEGHFGRTHPLSH